MTKVHVLADESLDGIQREYVEVDRPADEGDLIVCTKECALGGRFYGDGDVGVMQYKSDDYPSIYVKFLEGFGGPVSEGGCYVDNDAYTTLEPTDVVHIDGQRYRMVERKAEAGDKVIIVNAENTYGKYRNGSVIYVEDVTVYGIYNDDVRADDDNVYGIIGHDEYCVLDPLDSDDVVTTEEGDDKSVIELLANLARRVTELERQMEANTKDIAYLDERTRSTNDDPTFTLTQIIEALGGARP